MGRGVTSPADPERAFSEELASVLPELTAYAVRRCPDADDAADVVAEVLLVLWRRRARLPDSPDGRRAFAFGIARRVLGTHRRTRRRREALVARVATVLPRASSAQPDLDLRRALDRLRSIDRELVLLVAWDGYGVAEAGDLLGLSAVAARARYSRARRRLRDELDPRSE